MIPDEDQEMYVSGVVCSRGVGSLKSKETDAQKEIVPFCNAISPGLT